MFFFTHLLGNYYLKYYYFNKSKAKEYNIMGILTKCFI